MTSSRPPHPWLLVAALIVTAGCSDGPAAWSPTAADPSTAGPTSTATTGSEPANTGTAPGSTVATGRAPTCPGTESTAFGAFDLATGELTWSTCSPAESYRAVLGASAEVVIAQETKEEGGADTIALSATDGTELWRLSTAPAQRPGGDAAGSGVTTVYTDAEGTPFVAGIDVLTGEERWRLGPGSMPLACHERVVIVADSLQVPVAAAGQGSSPSVRGIDRTTGEELWVTDLNSAGTVGAADVRGSAAVADDVVVIPRDSGLTALDVASGTVLWSSDPLDRPTAVDGVVLGSVPSTTSGRGGVRAVDAETGRTLWSNPAVAASYGGWLAAGDGVLVTHHQQTSTVAIDLHTGEERWRTPLSVRGDPQVVAGTSAILLWEGTLGVVDTSDGSVRWTADRPLLSTFMSTVATNDTTVFVSVNSLPWSD